MNGGEGGREELTLFDQLGGPQDRPDAGAVPGPDTPGPDAPGPDGPDRGDNLDDGGDAGGADTGRVNHFPWDGETVDYSDAMLTRGRAYGSYVNTSRALPDVRDGLKPVQRRIIVAMDDLGIRADRRYSKSARTVGHVIGTYHPHGDTAVYDAMVRMAQPWQSNLPLLDGQGNWGNLNNEAPAAAQRYTECRLSPAATEFLADLRPEIVAYEPNFDETRMMPSVLPVTFPNLLVNGSMGVGWAMACSIPPHNTAEVINAALLIADNPNTSLDKLLAVLPGPDLPGGGIVVNPENLRAAYETGRGTVVVQGRIEQLPGQQVLRITELPHQVSARSIVEQAVQGAKDGKISEIYTAELPKNLTDANGVDVQIKCKRGGSIEKLTAELLAHTKLRDTLSFNFTVLVGGTPKTLSLPELLAEFVQFRMEVVTRRLEHERSVLQRRVHLLLAERAAADVIDTVIRIIRQAADDADSRAKLMEHLRFRPHGQARRRPIDEVQAQHIIDMPLKRLNNLNQLRLDEELRDKETRIDEIEATLASEGGVRQIVKQELRETRKRYGRPRRTVIAAGRTDQPGRGRGQLPLVVASAPGDDVWVHLATDGAMLVTDRGGRLPSSSPLELPGTASLAAVVAARTDQTLLLFSAGGVAFRASLSDPAVSRSGSGRPVVELSAGDRLVAAFVSPDREFYLLVTERGQLKRLPAKTLQAAHAGGMLCCRLAEGDRVVAVVPHTGEDVILAKASGQMLRLHTGDALRPVASAAAGTVAGIRTASNDRVVGAAALTGRSLVSVVRSGQAVRTGVDGYPVGSRGASGVTAVRLHRPEDDLRLVISADADTTTVFTARGRLLGVEMARLPLGAPGDTPLPFLKVAARDAPAGVVADPPRP